MKKLNIKTSAKYILSGVDENFNIAFSNWMEGANKIIQEHYKKEYNQNASLDYMDGKKFVRIITKGIQTSAFGFIDKTNGNILKAAGWKAPARGPRGNLFDTKGGLGRVTPYGLEYNK